MSSFTTEQQQETPGEQLENPEFFLLFYSYLLSLHCKTPWVLPHHLVICHIWYLMEWHCNLILLTVLASPNQAKIEDSGTKPKYFVLILRDQDAGLRIKKKINLILSLHISWNGHFVLGVNYLPNHNEIREFGRPLSILVASSSKRGHCLSTCATLFF